MLQKKRSGTCRAARSPARRLGSRVGKVEATLPPGLTFYVQQVSIAASSFGFGNVVRIDT
jgi:hypothetical protein